MLHNLGQVAYLHTAGNRNLARGRVLQPTDEFEHSGLACTVFPHKTDLVLLADIEIYVRKEGKTSISNCNRIN